MSNQEGLPEKNITENLTEKINRAVQSYYEYYTAHEDAVPNIYNKISSNTENTLTKLRGLPMETKIRYMVDDEVGQGDVTVSKESWDVMSVGDFIKRIEENKEGINPEKYVEYLKENLVRIAGEGRDMSFLNDQADTKKFFMESAFDYPDYLTKFCTPYSQPWSIVPVWEIEE